MSGKKATGSHNGAAWTVPGTLDDEADKGTAGSRPVLVLGDPQADRDVQASEGGGDERSPEQIEAELDRTRARLSATLDELTDRLSPRSMARGAGRGVKEQFFYADSGRVRADRVGAVAGVVAAAAAVFLALRTWRRRS
jgi:Protein of unknown function (DUF3618)